MLTTTHPAAYCKVLPPGEVNAMISDPMSDHYESFKTTAVVVSRNIASLHIPQLHTYAT